MKQNKKTLFKRLIKKKPAVALLFVVLFAVIVLQFVPDSVLAQDDSSLVGDTLSKFSSTIITGILSIISSVLDIIILVLGKTLELLIFGLKTVASYGQQNQFAANKEVILGWQIVRDIVNSFYIVVMIAIAIATIIRYQPFHFKQALPRLILSAILVNFSRTLCLLAINFSTSVMATFTTAINDSWGAFVIGLRAPSFTALDPNSIGGIYKEATGNTVQQAQANQGFVADLFTPATAVVLQMVAIVFLLATAAAIAAYLIYLVVRIIMLWLLMIISPIAFFAWGTPGPKAKGQWGEWVGEFIKYVIAGPTLLFFIYIEIIFMVNNTKTNYGFTLQEVEAGGLSLILTPKIFIGYVVGMALLLMGYEQTQKLSLRGGQWAKKFDPNKVLTGAKDLALTTGAGLNNYLYSKGLSVRPGAAWQGIKSGLAARNQEYINTGDLKWAGRAANADKNNNRFRALVSAAAGGNSKFFEENGLIGLNRRSVLGRTLGLGGSVVNAATLGAAGKIGQGINNVAGAIDTYAANKIVGVDEDGNSISPKDTKKYKAARLLAKGLGVTSGASVLSSVLGDSLGPSRDLAAAYSALNDERESIVSKDALQEQMSGAEMTPLMGQQVGDMMKAKSIFDMEKERDALAASDLVKDQNKAKELDQTIQESKDAMGEEKFQSMKDRQQFVEEFAGLATSAYQADELDSLGGMSVFQLGASLGEDGENRGKRKQALTSEMRERLLAANISSQQMRAGRTRGLQKVKDELYPKGTNVEVEQVYINSQADRNPNSRDRWKAHAIQAAEGGDVNDFYAKHNPAFTYDVEGIKKIHAMHQKDLGMSEEESLEFIDQLNSVVKANRQVAMSGLTTSNDLGQIRLTTEAEHKQEVKKEWQKKSIDVLMKGGRAGQGTRQADGSWQLHEGVVEAATANPQAFLDQWENKWARNSSDARVAEMWASSGQMKEIMQAAIDSESTGPRKAEMKERFEDVIRMVEQRAKGAE